MLVRLYKFLELIKNSPARKNRFIIITNAIALALNVLLWFFLYYEINKIRLANPEIANVALPLHYNVFLGRDLYGSWYQAFIYPLLGFIFLLVNFIFTWLTYSKKNILSYFLGVTSILIQVSMFTSTILMLLINL